MQRENGVQRKNGGVTSQGNRITKKIKFGEMNMPPSTVIFLYPNIQLGPFPFSHFDPYSSLNDTTFNSF